MNLEINDTNLHLLLPGKITSVSSIYAEENNCSILEAIRKFYATDIYKQLQNEQTKLWHLGPVALYEMWKNSKNQNS